LFERSPVSAQFTAAKTVAKPTRIKFKTKSGETVLFRALETVRETVAVHFAH